ncbi:MAG: hypothetical protein KKB59_00130, partial [Spirochaetes bacterium]|nr:hypothetical protein [Spirochaetota bacterium]
LSADGLGPGLPSRLAVNRLSMQGGATLCVARRSWRELNIAPGPSEPATVPALSFLLEARRRAVAPERRVAVETINSAPAASSAYAPLLSELGFDSDRGSLTLW